MELAYKHNFLLLSYKRITKKTCTEDVVTQLLDMVISGNTTQLATDIFLSELAILDCFEIDLFLMDFLNNLKTSKNIDDLLWNLSASGLQKEIISHNKKKRKKHRLLTNIDKFEKYYIKFDKLFVETVEKLPENLQCPRETLQTSSVNSNLFHGKFLRKKEQKCLRSEKIVTLSLQKQENRRKKAIEQRNCRELLFSVNEMKKGEYKNNIDCNDQENELLTRLVFNLMQKKEEKSAEEKKSEYFEGVKDLSISHIPGVNEVIFEEIKDNESSNKEIIENIHSKITEVTENWFKKEHLAKNGLIFNIASQKTDPNILFQQSISIVSKDAKESYLTFNLTQEKENTEKKKSEHSEGIKDLAVSRCPDITTDVNKVIFEEIKDNQSSSKGLIENIHSKITDVTENLFNKEHIAKKGLIFNSASQKTGPSILFHQSRSIASKEAKESYLTFNLTREKEEEDNIEKKKSEDFEEIKELPVSPSLDITTESNEVTFEEIKEHKNSPKGLIESVTRCIQLSSTYCQKVTSESELEEFQGLIERPEHLSWKEVENLFSIDLVFENIHSNVIELTENSFRKEHELIFNIASQKTDSKMLFHHSRSIASKDLTVKPRGDFNLNSSEVFPDDYTKQKERTSLLRSYKIESETPQDRDSKRNDRNMEGNKILQSFKPRIYECKGDSTDFPLQKINQSLEIKRSKILHSHKENPEKITPYLVIQPKKAFENFQGSNYNKLQINDRYANISMNKDVNASETFEETYIFHKNGSNDCTISNFGREDLRNGILYCKDSRDLLIRNVTFTQLDKEKSIRNQRIATIGTTGEKRGKVHFQDLHENMIENEKARDSITYNETERYPLSLETVGIFQSNLLKSGAILTEVLYYAKPNGKMSIRPNYEEKNWESNKISYKFDFNSFGGRTTNSDIIGKNIVYNISKEIFPSNVEKETLFRWKMLDVKEIFPLIKRKVFLKSYLKPVLAPRSLLIFSALSLVMYIFIFIFDTCSSITNILT